MTRLTYNQIEDFVHMICDELTLKHKHKPWTTSNDAKCRVISRQNSVFRSNL